MTFDLFMSGFGGQGVLLAGNLLAFAAIETGKEACFFPTYGVEKRGGAANCSVIIADEEVGSPVVGQPSALACSTARWSRNRRSCGRMSTPWQSPPPTWRLRSAMCGWST